jgi:hypothetical protein
MASSTVASYPNSRASNSEKFSRIEMVRASDLPERYRTRLARLMEQFNFTGDELWMATDSCRVAIGKVCIRRKAGVIVRMRQGREEKCELGPCDLISRRTVQRMLDELVEVFGVLEVLYEANQWVPYGGDVVFRHSRTYRLRTEKLKPQQTYKQWRMQQKAAHSVAQFPRKPAQPVPSADSPAPDAALPRREKPAAEHRSTGRTARTEGRHTYRQTKAFKDRVEYHAAGCSGSVTTQSGQQIYVSADSNPEYYRAPLNRALAFKRALEEFGWTVESALEALKYHGFQLAADKSPPS